MKTNIFNLAILLAGAFLFFQCSNEVKVGFLMDEAQTGRWASDKELFIQSVEELGGTVVLGLLK
jgi:ABC-type xylose transport system substrate-binding protein